MGTFILTNERINVGNEIQWISTLLSHAYPHLSNKKPKIKTMGKRGNKIGVYAEREK